MLTKLVYPFIFWAVVIPTLAFIFLLILRLIFNYSDPNPFGAVGRFAYRIKKWTDRFVYPAARFLAGFKVNTKLAPLLTMLIVAVLSFFSLQIIWRTFFIIDGLTESIGQGNIKAVIGYIIYAALSVYILFIFIRFISMWFTVRSNKFLRFIHTVTEPVLAPARRLIPNVGMFDISAMIVLILIGLLQMVVLQLFVN